MASNAPTDGADQHDQQHHHHHQPPPQEPNPYASSSRWRHAESTAFARYEQERAAQSPHHHPHHHHTGPVARDADPQSAGVSDLADFLNKSRVDPSELHAPSDSHPHDDGSRPLTPRFKPVVAGAAEARDAVNHTHEEHEHGIHHHRDGPPPDGKEVVCGPLLNYRRMEGRLWVGSVLVVTVGGGKAQPVVPRLELRRVGGGGGERGEAMGVQGVCLYSDARNTFWRFDVVVEMEGVETRWEYALPGLRFASSTKPQVNNFFVPALEESMRIMFHSCNGFSIGTDEAAWSGPALWNDVQRKHREMPFHVM